MNKPSSREMSAVVPTPSALVPYRTGQETTGEEITLILGLPGCSNVVATTGGQS